MIPAKQTQRKEKKGYRIYGNDNEDETDFTIIAAGVRCCFRKVSGRTDRGQQTDCAKRAGIGQ